MANTLENSPADVLAYLLVQLSLGTDPSDSGSWPVYATNEPDSPDNVITTYDTAGTSDGRSQLTGEAWTHYGFQVRIRSTTPTLGWIKADSIRKTLAESVYDITVAVGDKRYLIHCVTRIGNVIALGKESPTSKRNLFTLNATVVLKQVS